MPIIKALDQFEPKGEFLFDCLFLDGFAPSKNSSMWHPAVLRRISFLCKQGSTLSTFSVASKVRHSLEKCGYQLTKIKGFGKKREMLTGTMSRTKAPLYKAKAPWFYFKASHAEPSVTIVGAGIAGCASAHALARKSIKCRLIESNDFLTGTLQNFNKSVFSASYSADFNSVSQFHWHAFHCLETLLHSTTKIIHRQCGVFYVADNEARIKRFTKAYALLKNTSMGIDWVDVEKTHDVTGIKLEYPGLFVNHAGWLSTQSLCRFLIKDPFIELQLNTTVINIEAEKSAWIVNTETDTFKTDNIVFCTGADIKLLKPYDLCRFDLIKGQTTAVDNSNQLGNLKTIINNGHYLIPDTCHKRLIVGASHDKASFENNHAEVDKDIENLVAVKHLNDGINQCFDKRIEQLTHENTSNSNSGVRLSTRDHLPLVGPIPEAGFYRKQYPDFLNTGRLRGCPDGKFLPGLFINTAHGSRGVTSSVLCGEIIAALVSTEHLPLPSRLYHAVHPARFLIRDMLRESAKSGSKPA